ncbi:MAG: DinB family protein [Candidatus Kapaibacterium sp.]
MTIEEIIRELEQESENTRRVLERVPPDRLGWTPHEKSMTMGQLALHIAKLPGAIAGISARPSFDVTAKTPRPEATSISELLETLAQSVEQAKKILSDMNDADLETPWRMVNGDRELFAIPRGVFLRSVMLNHWYHHRGQLTVYLRQTGALLPAIYGSSADENPMA